ncbi:MAG: shikimate dehydrogenase [Candidatus Micrarchaeota archaeon]
MAGTDIFAIIGKPVLHSRSPQMHNAAFEELGLDAHYVRIATESREDGLDIARRMGIRGMNVTSPFKDIIEIVDSADPVAAKVGAVNTVLFKDGRTLGYNTDAHGVSESFIANGIGIKGKKAVVLGAGGAARAAVVAMIENGAEVTIANRTVEKAKAMAQGFGVGYCSLSMPDLKKALAGCNLVVGCLNTSERVVPAGLLRPDMAIMDAYYASQSALTKDGLAAGCKVIDGREWLLHQGARAFGLFTGKKAPVGVMRKAVYAQNAKHEAGNIALVGMMGSGKDSVAKALSASNGMPVIDTDAEIVRMAGMEIKVIFAKAGEGGFRKMERGVLASLDGTTKHIINCGGGAVLNAQNRKTLKRVATVVWLWADAGTILARLPKDGSRPLLDGAEPEKKLNGLLAERMGAYAESSDLVLDTVGRTPEEIAGRILYEIH